MTHFWILAAAAALAVPALLGAFLPCGWRWKAMLLWLVSPAFVYAVLITREIAARPPEPNDFHNAMLGFSLISALFLIPWLLASGLGFAIGLGIGRILRSADAPSAEPLRPAVPSFVPPPQPPVLETHGWRSVHIGFSDDGLKIGGQPVWKQEWRPSGEPSLMLPHPAYPDQSHRFDIYAIGESRKRVRFAAGELSNGVWGFYVPVDPPHGHP